MRWVGLAAWSIAFGALGLKQSGRACDVTIQEVTHVLGAAGFDISVLSAVEVPRNLAFVFHSGRPESPLFDERGEPVELELLGPDPERAELGLRTAREPLEPGHEYTLEWVGTIRVADYIDEVAPNAPRPRTATLLIHEPEGCGGDSCGDSTDLQITLEPGSDDHADASALSYAIYLGSSAREASTKQAIDKIMMLDFDGSIRFPAREGLVDRDVWIAISTLDLAGNESPRSEPMKVRAIDSGCRVGLSPALESFGWIVAAIAFQAVRSRRRGR